MKMYLTGVQEILAKKTGVKWVKLSALSAESGETVDTMIEAEKVKDVEALKKSVLSSDELVEAFGGFEPVEVTFNMKGRVHSVEA